MSPDHSDLPGYNGISLLVFGGYGSLPVRPKTLFPPPNTASLAGKGGVAQQVSGAYAAAGAMACGCSHPWGFGVPQDAIVATGVLRVPRRVTRRVPACATVSLEEKYVRGQFSYDILGLLYC